MNMQKLKEALEIVAGAVLMVTFVPWLMLLVYIIEKIVK